MAGVWRDCNWVTGLGTCFYDRRVESGRLAGLVGRYPLVVLAGPRNAGKSELARYVARRVLGLKPIIIDARRLLVDALGVVRDAELARFLRTLARRLAEERLGLGALIELLETVYRRLGFDKLIVIDEVHLLGGRPVETLEALAKMLRFYPGYEGWRIVVTCSEGFVYTRRLGDRLDGYGGRVFTVEPLDEWHARSLYSEYRGLRGCSVDWSLYWRLVGGLPGYLPDICNASREDLLEWIWSRVEALRRSVARASETTGVGLEEACRAAYRLLVEGIDPLLDPTLAHIADTLVEDNIAYPSRGRLKPQLNIYTLATEALARTGCRKPPNPQELLDTVQQG